MLTDKVLYRCTQLLELVINTLSGWALVWGTSHVLRNPLDVWLSLKLAFLFEVLCMTRMSEEKRQAREKALRRGSP